MENIIVQRTIYDINEDINTTNHSKDPNDLEAAALDYSTEIKKTNLMNYAHIINYPIDWSYSFNADEMKILTKCALECVNIGRINLFHDELDPIILRLKTSWKDGMWFFRFNSRSPKDGACEYPVFSADQVITMIVTSRRGLASLSEGEDTIYFVKYEEGWDRKREFRVFIYKKKVTAISQYTLDKCMLSGKSTLFAKEIALKIKNYLENDILPLICPKIHTDNMVCDIYVKDDCSLRIIEFNSFGYWLASGSALFHWLRDKELLYNQKDMTYLRFRK